VTRDTDIPVCQRTVTGADTPVNGRDGANHALPGRNGRREPLGDVSLARKVESVAFRQAGVPKSRVNAGNPLIPPRACGSRRRSVRPGPRSRELQGSIRLDSALRRAGDLDDDVAAAIEAA
jgi:hypothetical protein